MLSPRFATPLRLRIETSRRLQLAVLIFFLLSLLALILTPLDGLVRLFATLLLAAVFIKVWRARAELGGTAVALTLRPNGMWLREQGDDATPLQLLGQSTLSGSLLLLCLAEPQGRRRFDCVLWQAELPPPLWRRLRVYLKLYASDAC